MTLDNLQKLIAQGESETLEFKKSTARLHAAFETVCAFLNNKGGIVLIGVRDDGKIFGQQISDKTRQEIATELLKLEPSAQSYVNIEYIPDKHGKEIIAINVIAGTHIPYTYDGRPFQRVQTTTSKMPQHRYEQLIIERGQLNHAWDEQIADDYDIDALDHEEIYQTVLDGIAKKRIPPSAARENAEEILKQFELLKNGKPKRAAVILFGKEIKSEYTQCLFKMARFEGINKSGDFIDSQQMHCNIFRMLEAADNFLRKHLNMASYFREDQFQRIDKWTLPTLAVREALINAMCHKNYTDRNGYISMAIFDNHMDIWNNGTLPVSLKLEDLKRKHESVPRNKLIANALYLRGYIETWGTGTTKMIDLCRKNTVPIPKFSERTGGLVVGFKFAAPIGIRSQVEKIELTKRQQEIIKLLETSKLNSAEIVTKLKNAPSRRTVQLDLAQLEKVGLIIREGERRSIRWVFIK